MDHSIMGIMDTSKGHQGGTIGVRHMGTLQLPHYLKTRVMDSLLNIGVIFRGVEYTTHPNPKE